MLPIQHNRVCIDPPQWVVLINAWGEDKSRHFTTSSWPLWNTNQHFIIDFPVFWPPNTKPIHQNYWQMSQRPFFAALEQSRTSALLHMLHSSWHVGACELRQCWASALSLCGWAWLIPVRGSSNQQKAIDFLQAGAYRRCLRHLLSASWQTLMPANQQLTQTDASVRCWRGLSHTCSDRSHSLGCWKRHNVRSTACRHSESCLMHVVVTDGVWVEHGSSTDNRKIYGERGDENERR